jgi:two-component system sensor histidine kinase RcsD
MLNKYLSLTSTNITRFFWLFILLLIAGLGLYGYNYCNVYLADKQHMLRITADLLQKRIDNYRYITYQIYDNFNSQPTTPPPVSDTQEVRVHQDMFHLVKPHHKTDAVILGNHENTTLDFAIKVSGFLDTTWGPKGQPYAMYYLNGQDNSLILITTQSLQQQDPRSEESYATSLQTRRNEMLQQANTLDERESYSNLRKYPNASDYYFSLRTTFNNPGHLATVLAFDLPMNDLIPHSMPIESFQLSTNNSPINEGDASNDGNQACTITLRDWHLYFGVPLSNSPLVLSYNMPVNQVMLDLSHNNLWLLLINLFLIAMAMSGIYFIRHRYIRPSENMAAQLALQQGLNQEIVSNLEIGLLIYNFASNSVISSNKLAEQLLPHLSLSKITTMTDQHHGIIQVTVNNEIYEIRTIRSDISPDSCLFLIQDQDKQMMVNRTLHQARREFEKNLQARKLMLHNLGSELCQPLNELQAQIQVLTHETQNTDERKKIENAIQLLSQQAVNRIDNLTLLTRLETQDWQTQQQTYQLCALVDEVLLAALPHANQKGLLLLNHVQLSQDSQFLGDAQTLKKILSLLLDYALVCTPLGKVTLSCQQDPQSPEMLNFQITDTGDGLSQDELNNLNYPFLSQALADRVNQGSGLTFYLCDQLCKQLGGKLAIHSKQGIGTRYNISIKQQMVSQETDEQGEKLLDDVTLLLDITSDEVRTRVTRVMSEYGARCIVVDERQPKHDYDVLLTDNPQHSDAYTLLLSHDECGSLLLGKHYIRANYNLSGALLDATLLLIEQQFADSNDNDDNTASEDGINDVEFYEKQLKSSDYYQLFVETVPEDLEKLYNESQHCDFASLSQTAHRLKGVFAMLNLTPGKHLCETLEHHIAEGDVFMTADIISQINSFVSRLLHQGN